MKRSLVATLAAALLAIVTAVPVGADESPAAMVYLGEDNCRVSWFGSDGTVIDVFGDSITVQSDHAGRATVMCRFSIDFDDPSIAPPELVCGVLPELCRGNGNGALVEAREDVRCFSGTGLETEDVMGVVTPSGQRMMVCHFDY